MLQSNRHKVVPWRNRQINNCFITHLVPTLHIPFINIKNGYTAFVVSADYLTSDFREIKASDMDLRITRFFDKTEIMNFCIDDCLWNIDYLRHSSITSVIPDHQKPILRASYTSLRLFKRPFHLAYLALVTSYKILYCKCSFIVRDQQTIHIRNNY